MPPGDREWRERGLHAAVLAGDARAWQTWYDQSFADLYAYVVWRCAGLRDVADEIAQETWLTAVRRIVGFDPAAGSFAGWLRGIAANLLRNHFVRPDAGRQLTRSTVSCRRPPRRQTRPNVLPAHSRFFPNITKPCFAPSTWSSTAWRKSLTAAAIAPRRLNRC